MLYFYYELLSHQYVFQNNNANTTSYPAMKIDRTAPNSLAGDTLGSISIWGKDGAGTSREWSRIQTKTENVGVGNQDGTLSIFNSIFLYFSFIYIYGSVLSVTPIFASCSVISIYLIYNLNFHFKQYISCFARTGVEGNLGLYFADDSQDVILTMQHGFTMTVSVKLDKDGYSYFNADLWKKCLSVMN